MNDSEPFDLNVIKADLAKRKGVVSDWVTDKKYRQMAINSNIDHSATIAELEYILNMIGRVPCDCVNPDADTGVMCTSCTLNEYAAPNGPRRLAERRSA